MIEMIEILVLFSPQIGLGLLLGWAAVSAFAIGSPLWITLAVISVTVYGGITYQTARSDTPDGGAGGIGWLCMTGGVVVGLATNLILTMHS